MKKYSFTFIRGGTSRAAFFKKQDLPDDQAEWPTIFRSVLGVHTPADAASATMGQDLPSHKVAVISKSERAEADVEYHFFQIDPKSGFADSRGSCGNMASAVAPFAIDEGMVSASDGENLVRIYHTNTKKIIESRVQAKNGRALVHGDVCIAGVPGTGSPILLDFLNPGGGYSGNLFPTGNPTDTITLPDSSTIRATIIDCGNPCAVIDAGDLGLSGYEISEFASLPEIRKNIEIIRCVTAQMLGLVSYWEDARTNSTYIPQVAIVSTPGSYTATDGTAVHAEDMDINLRAFFTSLHKACPVTTGIATAASAKLQGTVAYTLACKTNNPFIRIGHPSGTLQIGVESDGHSVQCCTILRTSRRLFDGLLYTEQE
ncbi:MAG: PrpF domain-containing protein [Clostridiaceae bacterium]|nr:PrpF domain-containing protein [Clostridiaceae bacterium]